MVELKAGDKTKCGRCNKKVTVLEITSSGSKVICAPCEVCCVQNTISSEKWVRGPAEVDLTNQHEVVRYMRDLINLSSLLEQGADSELSIFMSKLKAAGYSDTARQRLLQYASTNTRYDHLTDVLGRKLVPRVIPDGGR